MQKITKQEKLVNMLKIAINSKVVPYITSSPGLGKSAMVQQLADKLKMKLITFVATTKFPEDTSGLPRINSETNKAEYTPFDFLPTESDKVPDGYQGWILFIDELPAAEPAMQIALQMLILNRETGNLKLHPRVRIICAGNRVEDKSHANNLAKSLDNRVLHLPYNLTLKDWLNWAENEGNIDWRIISFFDVFKDHKYLNNFNPQNTEKAYATPRSWEMLSKLIKDFDEISGSKYNTNDLINDYQDLITGCVGENVGTQFLVFLKNYLTLPKYQEVCNDPSIVSLPLNPQTKTCAINYLINSMVNSKNLSIKDKTNVTKYIERMEQEYHVLYAIKLKSKVDIFDSPDLIRFLEKTTKDLI